MVSFPPVWVREPPVLIWSAAAERVPAWSVREPVLVPGLAERTSGPATEMAPPVCLRDIGEAARPMVRAEGRAVELVPVVPPVRVSEPPVQLKSAGLPEISREAAEREPPERMRAEPGVFQTLSWPEMVIVP